MIHENYSHLPEGSGIERAAPSDDKRGARKARALDLAVSRETIAVRALAEIDCVIDGQPLHLPSSHPGTVIASESTGGSDFMLRFSNDSRLQWLKVFPVAGRLGHSIARTPEGGVLGALRLDGNGTSGRYLVSWRADGTAAWSGDLGCNALPRMASNGDWFMLKTDDFGLGACDLEPGVTSEPADGTPYLVRYHF